MKLVVSHGLVKGRTDVRVFSRMLFCPCCWERICIVAFAPFCVQIDFVPGSVLRETRLQSSQNTATKNAIKESMMMNTRKNGERRNFVSKKLSIQSIARYIRKNPAMGRKKNE